HPSNTQLLTAGADGLLKVWAFPPVPPRSIAHPDAVLSAVLSADGRRLITGGQDKIVRAWNAANGQMERQFQGHAGPVTAVAVSPDGNRLLTGCTDKQARLWNLANGQLERALPGNTLAVSAVAFSANGATVAAGGADKSLLVWNVADGKELKRLTLPAPVLSVA